MFKVFVNDGKEEIPTDEICYIVGKTGVFLKKKIGLIESVAPVSNISILQDVIPTAKLNIPKIPGNLFAQMYSFTKQVYELHGSESVVLIYYNSDKETFKLVVPKQEVSTASIEYTKDASLPNYDVIGTLHSHSGFSAFHSSIDDKDEKHFDGIHITIGKLGSPNFELSCSIVSNGSRFISDPEEYINGIRKISYENSKIAIKDYKLFDSLNNIECETRWLDNVEKKTYEYAGFLNRSGFAKYRDMFGFGNFDYTKHKDKTKNPYLKQTIPKQFGIFEDVDNDDYSPCEECPFKNYKLEMMIEELEESQDDDVIIDEENGIMNIDGVIYGY